MAAMAPLGYAYALGQKDHSTTTKITMGVAGLVDPRRVLWAVDNGTSVRDCDQGFILPTTRYAANSRHFLKVFPQFSPPSPHHKVSRWDESSTRRILFKV